MTAIVWTLNNELRGNIDSRNAELQEANQNRVHRSSNKWWDLSSVKSTRI